MRSILLAICMLACVALPAQKWHAFTSSKGAFAVTFPATPDVKEITRQSPEGFSVTSHMHITLKEPVSAFVIYNQFESGINIEDDSIYLTTITQEMMAKFADKFENAKADVKDIEFEGYPGKSFTFEVDASISEIRVILRSNRAYILMGIFPKKQKEDLDKFFKSFKFLAFQPTQYVQHKVGKELKLDLPSKPIFDKETSDEFGADHEVYSAQDINTGDSYSILITRLSKYDQYENDTAYVDQRVDAFRDDAEENNQDRYVKFGDLLAKELIVTSRKHMAVRYLAFARGSTGYLLLTTVHPSHLKNATSEKFFSSVKFEGKPTGDLYSDKSSVILKDLVSPDTAISNRAKESMSSVDFSEKNFDEITSYLKKNYADDKDSTNSRKEHLLDALNTLKSEKSVAFVENIFPTLKTSILEYSAISIVAAIETRAALDARIRLLAKHTPAEDIVYHPVVGLYTVDSADQKYFYEKTNYLLKSKPYKLTLYYFMKHLMEEKRLSLQEIAPWRTAINADFDAEMKTFKADSTFKNLDDFIVIMKYYDVLDKKQLTTLQEISSAHDTYLGILAATTLLKHKQVVPTKLLAKFAKDHYNRITLYDEFEKNGLIQHYPKAYLNQDSLAVSQVYSYLQEDDFTPGKVEIAYKGLEAYKGKQMKFYVMRVYDSDAEVWYRGTIGPFDPKKLATWGEMNYIDFQEDPKEDYKKYLVDLIAESTAVEE